MIDTLPATAANLLEVEGPEALVAGAGAKDPRTSAELVGGLRPRGDTIDIGDGVKRFIAGNRMAPVPVPVPTSLPTVPTPMTNMDVIPEPPTGTTLTPGTPTVFPGGNPASATALRNDPDHGTQAMAGTPAWVPYAFVAVGPPGARPTGTLTWDGSAWVDTFATDDLAVLDAQAAAWGLSGQPTWGPDQWYCYNTVGWFGYAGWQSGPPEGFIDLSEPDWS